MSYRLGVDVGGTFTDLVSGLRRARGLIRVISARDMNQRERTEYEKP
jgi:uncharacterized DUF497 family protein